MIIQEDYQDENIKCFASSFQDHSTETSNPLVNVSSGINFFLTA